MYPTNASLWEAAVVGHGVVLEVGEEAEPVLVAVARSAAAAVEEEEGRT